jgi:hypothetical protein
MGEIRMGQQAAKLLRESMYLLSCPGAFNKASAAAAGIIRWYTCTCVDISTHAKAGTPAAGVSKLADETSFIVSHGST